MKRKRKFKGIAGMLPNGQIDLAKHKRNKALDRINAASIGLLILAIIMKAL